MAAAAAHDWRKRPEMDVNSVLAELRNYNLDHSQQEVNSKWLGISFPLRSLRRLMAEEDAGGIM
jgi:hypothetical protein